jgi:hypothetical protein
MAGNIRVLVSNLGDGNWGTATLAADSPFLLNSTNKEIYFPPAFNADGTQDKGTAPSNGTADLDIAGQYVGLIGWSSKTNYIVQIKATAAAAFGSGQRDTNFVASSVIVNAVRPTGVKEQVMVSTASTCENTFKVGGSTVLVQSYGGFESDAIEGPVSYFEFISNAATGTIDIQCYVIAWNEGDISDGLADKQY